MVCQVLRVDSEIDWSKVSFVKRSKYRKSVLKALEEPSMPSELADELDLHQSHVSRALIEMEEKGLAEILNPEDSHGRMYRRTSQGEELLKEIPD